MTRRTFKPFPKDNATVNWYRVTWGRSLVPLLSADQERVLAEELVASELSYWLVGPVHPARSCAQRLRSLAS